jgi:hypothetical protein
MSCSPNSQCWRTPSPPRRTRSLARRRTASRPTMGVSAISRGATRPPRRKRGRPSPRSSLTAIRRGSRGTPSRHTTHCTIRERKHFTPHPRPTMGSVPTHHTCQPHLTQLHTWRLLLIVLIQLRTVASSLLMNVACLDMFKLPEWHHTLSSITLLIGTHG